MKKYFRVWKQLATLSISSYFSNRIEYGSYFIGKIIRFVFFWIMVASIFKYTSAIAGYSKYQAMIFLVTAFFVDALGQAFFRGAYDFRNDVKKGTADYLITKPINPLFIVMLRLTDILDIIFIGLLTVLLIVVFLKSGILISAVNILSYLLFVGLGVVILAGIHIMSIALTIWTMESESIIWVYRSAMFASLFPPEIFSQPAQIFFTFFIPIVVVVAFPAKAFLGLLTLENALVGFAVAIAFFIGSLLLWRVALKQYSSASS
jgi:ABC-2 type transport system permease protein